MTTHRWEAMSTESCPAFRHLTRQSSKHMPQHMALERNGIRPLSTGRQATNFFHIIDFHNLTISLRRIVHRVHRIQADAKISCAPQGLLSTCPREHCHGCPIDHLHSTFFGKVLTPRPGPSASSYCWHISEGLCIRYTLHDHGIQNAIRTKS